MALTGFGPYNGLWLEDAATKCIGVTPTQWAMTHALGSKKNVTEVDILLIC